MIASKVKTNNIIITQYDKNDPTLKQYSMFGVCMVETINQHDALTSCLQD